MRRLLLVGVFIFCGWAFWVHFERRFAAIEAHVALMDEPGLFSQDDRTALFERRELLESAFGVKVLVQLKQTTVHIPELPGNTLFVGLTPNGRQTAVVLPPLLKRALPEGFKRQAEQRLESCASSPGPCVTAVLDEILGALKP